MNERDGRQARDDQLCGVPRPSCPQLVLVASLAGPSCLRPNPAFDDGRDASTVHDVGLASGTDGLLPTSTASADASGLVTSGGGDSTMQAGGSTFAGEVSTSGGPTNGDSTNGESTNGESTNGGSTAGGSTDGASPGIYDVPAAIGTCVFVAVEDYPFHGGPDECSGDANAINATALGGLMMVDIQVNDGPGQTRPAVPYLRFDVPKELAGLTLLSATLHVQVADGVTDLPQSGTVWLSVPFSDETLKTVAPTLVESIAADKGEVQPDEWLSWQIDPGLITLGQPLHLALKPTHDKGVILRGATTAPGAPHLTLEVE